MLHLYLNCGFSNYWLLVIIEVFVVTSNYFFLHAKEMNEKDEVKRFDFDTL